jgi:hypothetical protein
MLVPLILAAWIAWVLLPACGTRLPLAGIVFGWGNGTFCAQAHPELDVAAQRSQALLSKVALLKQQVRQHARECVPPAPAPQPGQTMDKVLRDNNIPIDPTMLTLLWHDHADLDLHLICPDGKEVYFPPSNKYGCGAEFNFDMNRSDQSQVDDPVENITWGQGAMPPGHYRVRVKLYGRNDVTDPTIDYTVRLKQRGKPDKTTEGHIGGPGDVQQIMEFDVP